MHTRKILFCAMLAASAHASAATTASVSFSNLRYTLIDLNLNDGITPSLTMFYDRSYYEGGMAVAGYIDIGNVNERIVDEKAINTGSPAINPWQVSAKVTGSSTQGTIYGVDNLTNYGLSLESTVDTPTETALNGAYGSLHPNDFYYRVSGNTRVIFELDSHVQTHIDGFGSIEFAEARSDATMTGPGEVPSYFYSHFLQTTTYLSRDPNTNIEETLVFDFKNTSSQIGGGLFRSFASTSVSATPVPEPTTGAMIVSGLALVGLIARRRQNA